MEGLAVLGALPELREVAGDARRFEKESGGASDGENTPRAERLDRIVGQLDHLCQLLVGGHHRDQIEIMSLRAELEAETSKRQKLDSQVVDLLAQLGSEPAGAAFKPDRETHHEPTPAARPRESTARVAERVAKLEDVFLMYRNTMASNQKLPGHGSAAKQSFGSDKWSASGMALESLFSGELSKEALDVFDKHRARIEVVEDRLNSFEQDIVAKVVAEVCRSDLRHTDELQERVRSIEKTSGSIDQLSVTLSTVQAILQDLQDRISTIEGLEDRLRGQHEATGELQDRVASLEGLDEDVRRIQDYLSGLEDTDSSPERLRRSFDHLQQQVDLQAIQLGHRADEVHSQEKFAAELSQKLVDLECEMRTQALLLDDIRRRVGAMQSPNVPLTSAKDERSKLGEESAERVAAAPVQSPRVRQGLSPRRGSVQQRPVTPPGERPPQQTPPRQPPARASGAQPWDGAGAHAGGSFCSSQGSVSHGRSSPTQGPDSPEGWSMSAPARQHPSPPPSGQQVEVYMPAGCRASPFGPGQLRTDFGHPGWRTADGELTQGPGPLVIHQLTEESLRQEFGAPAWRDSDPPSQASTATVTLSTATPASSSTVQMALATGSEVMRMSSASGLLPSPPTPLQPAAGSASAQTPRPAVPPLMLSRVGALTVQPAPVGCGGSITSYRQTSGSPEGRPESPVGLRSPARPTPRPTSGTPSLPSTMAAAAVGATQPTVGTPASPQVLVRTTVRAQPSPTDKCRSIYSPRTHTNMAIAPLDVQECLSKSRPAAFQAGDASTPDLRNQARQLRRGSGASPPWSARATVPARGSSRNKGLYSDLASLR